MKNRNLSFSVQSLTLALGVATTALIGCSGTEATVPDSGMGGSMSSGGAAPTGGVATGGAGPTGGVATGGVATGGVATGGAGPTGGVATGGVATGGVTTGGAGPTGGVATGGVATGGAGPTGGVATGGVATGGSGAGMNGGSGGAGMNGGSGGSGMGGSSTGGTSGSMGNGGASSTDNKASGPNTMGWIGCSMGENVATGYRRIGGTRMWGGYGNGGAVVQQWTSEGAAWQRFDRQKGSTQLAAVWIMICIFANAGVTDAEVDSMVAQARRHAPGAYIYITGQPTYRAGYECSLAGDGGVALTDRRAQAAPMRHPDVHYAGTLGPLNDDERADVCHANATGEDKLGRQARAIWGD